MEVFKAIILGVVEGLTEFLPVSSTGHLIVAEDLLGFYDTSKMFTVVIQTGAIAAVIWFYRRDLFKLFVDIFKSKPGARRFLWIWVLATFPAGLVGLLFEDRIESVATSLTVAIALILGGIVIWLVEKYHRIPKSDKPHLNKLSINQSIKIGLYQVLALIPGVSRSGATIIGAMLSGVDRVTATAFSFYLGIPILLLAGLYKFSTGDISTIPGGSPALIAGMLASFATAFIVVGWLLSYVSRHNFIVFAYYRIVFGIILLVLIGMGRLN